MNLQSCFHYAVSTIAVGAFAAAFASVAALSQQMPPNGRMLFEANCATCHGLDGRGKRTRAEVGFDLPMPDFTNCSFATREATGDWSSIIHEGGPRRAFPRIMPAFGDALSDDEIDAIISYMRTFCAEKERWPSGDFNFPLALYTEKAFPEDELVWTTAINTEGATGITSQMTLEKRFGSRGQLEVTVPFGIVDNGPGVGTRAGIGDLAFAWKQNVYANVDQGTIVTLLGEAVLPTGNTRYGLGAGSLSLEPHFLFGQMLPDDFIFQGQVFGEFPLRSDYVKEAGFTMALGKTFAEDDGWGRSWTPMVELLNAHELTSHGATDWDIVPQMQVSLSQRQHILFSAGARIPMNNTSERSTQFVFYILWDWYDAGLFQGWR